TARCPSGNLSHPGRAVLPGSSLHRSRPAEPGRSALAALEERLLRAADSFAGGSTYLKTALDAAADSLYAIPAALSQRLLGLLTRLAQNSPDALLFAVTAGIGAYFSSAAWPRVLAFLRAQLPERLRRRLAGLGQDLKQSFGGWLRAQCILAVITFFELLLVFLLLRIRAAALIAALTALIDALPVFGTGAVLVPWALAALLLGDTGRGLGLLIAWGTVSLVRSCLQAKLVGDQIGLDPIASLLAVYAGWRVWGVWGTLSFPLLLVTLRQLNDKGVLRLWKTP
ncbi:MAG: AI-2E family transporter, partial [Oscillospiraceae bacterium]|nr:AI-2E family transporter [Oscillospiraceae bacterium]